MGGLWAIYALIDVDGGAEGQQTLAGPSALGQLVDYLQIGIASAEEHVVALAARAVGRLASVQGAVALSEVCSAHVTAALDTFALVAQVGAAQASSSSSSNTSGGSHHHHHHPGSGNSSGIMSAQLVAGVGSSVVPSARRLASALVLSEVMRQAGNAMHVHVARLLDVLWTALSDELAGVRERVQACVLALVSYVDDKALRYDVHVRLYALVRDHSHEAYPSAVLAVLALLRALLERSGDFMRHQVRFGDATDLTLRYGDHKDRSVRLAVLALVPALARCNGPAFTQNSLSQFMSQLLLLLQSRGQDATRDREVLAAIGGVARAVGSAFAPYLAQVVPELAATLAVKGSAKDSALSSSISSNSSNSSSNASSSSSATTSSSSSSSSSSSTSATSATSSSEVADEALSSLAALVEATGERVYSSLDAARLLDVVFEQGEQRLRSGALAPCLAALVRFAPSLRKEVQRRLLELLRRVLEQALAQRSAAHANDMGMGTGATTGSGGSSGGGGGQGGGSGGGSGGGGGGGGSQGGSSIQRSITRKTLKMAKALGKRDKDKDKDRDPYDSHSHSHYHHHHQHHYQHLLGDSYEPLDVSGDRDRDRDRGASTSSSSPLSPMLSGGSGDEDLVLLALRTLGSFPFYSTVGNLDGVVRNFLLPFFDDQSASVRSASAVTCAKLIIAAEGTVSALLKAEALEKLLVVAIADPAPEIRVTVLAQLQHASLDATLAQVEHLASLFIALNDEVQEVRELAMTAIGRLSSANPSYTMPLLRRAVIQLLSELEFSDDAALQAGATRLLTVLLRAARELVAPYAAPMLHALIARLRGAAAQGGELGRVTLAALACLGELAGVDADAVRPYLDELTPLLLRCATDHASKRRRLVGVQVLGQLARSTGYVIEPYRTHPALLPLLLELVRTEKDRAIRREVIKTLGILGAVDPAAVAATHAPSTSATLAPSGSGAGGGGGFGNHKGSNPYEASTAASAAPPASLVAALAPPPYAPGEEYFPSVAVAALTRVLLDSTLSAYHRVALRTVLEVLRVHCRGESTRVRRYLAQVLPALLHTLRSSERAGQRLLPLLAQLVALARHEIEPYLESVFALVRGYLVAVDSDAYFDVLLLVEEVAKVAPDALRVYLPELVPHVLRALHYRGSAGSGGGGSGGGSDGGGGGGGGGSSQAMMMGNAGGALLASGSSPLSPSSGALASSGASASSSTSSSGVGGGSGVGESERERRVAQSTLRTLVAIGKGLQEYLHVLAPAVVALLERAEEPAVLRLLALQTLGHLCRLLNVREYASRIIHPLARLLQQRSAETGRELKEAALKILCTLLFQLGSDYAVFIPVLKRILARQGAALDSVEYAALVTKLLKNQPIREADLPRFGFDAATTSTSAATSATSASVAGATTSNGNLNATAVSEEGAETAAPSTASAVSSSAAVAGGGGGEGTQRWELRVNEAALLKAWKTRRQSSKEDWLEWLRRFALALIRESPAPAFRLCTELAQDFPPLVRELFNAAFICLWQRLSPAAHADLSAALTAAFQSGTTPPEVLQELLALAEFLEHAKTALPVALADLARLAESCHAYAKALHYREQELARLMHAGSGATPEAVETLEALLSLTNQLRQPHAAQGVLLLAQRQHVALQESWHEKLHRWSDALAHYETQERARRQDEERAEQPRAKLQHLRAQHESRLGQMRCLRALGEWDRLLELAESTWPAADDLRASIAPLAAHAAWQLQQWQLVEHYAEAVPLESVQGSFFRAVVALHQRRDTRALELVQEARDALDTELSALASESYGRAYDAVVTLQQLAELEEIVALRALQAHTSDRALAQRARERLERTWQRRLAGMQRVPATWQSVLAVRQLLDDGRVRHASSSSSTRAPWPSSSSSSTSTSAYALSEMERAWLKYASLEREAGNLRRSHATLVALVGYDPLQRALASPALTAPPRVAYAVAKQLWAADVPALALRQLVQLEQILVEQRRRARRAHTSYDVLGSSNSSSSSGSLALNQGTGDVELEALLVRVYLRLGSWLWQRRGGPDALPAYSRALQHAQHLRGSDEQRKAWAAWAQVNSALVEHWEAEVSAGKVGKDKEGAVLEHAVAAVHAHFQALAHAHSAGRASELRSVLRLLRLLFRFGASKEVAAAWQQGFSTGNVDTWLQVIPQIIARLDAPAKPVRRLVHDLLVAVGREHPQALVYPLTVAASHSAANAHEASLAPSSLSAASALPFANPSGPETRTGAAQLIMEQMRRHSARLMDQALLVSRELQRIAVSWLEAWYNALEEAANAYFEARDPVRMLALLQPLHALTFDAPPHSLTLLEAAFYQAYARDLREAREWTRRYERERDVAQLQQAWAHYYAVFKALATQLPALKHVRLRYASPALEAARSLELAVPGTYEAPPSRLQCIARFESRLPIITSKRRPRKLSVVADSGAVFAFLLKGHEDLRQDERAMQLFGLVNSLLASTRAYHGDHALVQRALAIKRYAVIPLSPSTGLIGWVEGCDTLNDLVTEYRTRVAAPPIPLKFELQRMRELAHEHYDALRPLQKAEIFGKALSVYDGKDLYAMMWLRAATSEAWLEQRTTYTSTLAVMSMVGYVLGLGDRHPSNIMLERRSGAVVHIDFGDCFEVASDRDAAPERVPFRLTRMLVNAMEVAGIDGSFRASCEHVMRVLRDNRDALMAVLEAFVHDPLINWRLVGSGGTGAAIAGAHASARASASTSAASAASSSQHPLAVPPRAEATFSLTRTLARTRQRSDTRAEATGEDADVVDEAVKVLDELRSKPSPPHRSSMIHAGHHYSRLSSVAGSTAATGGGTLIADDRISGVVVNERALAVIGRVDKKLSGRDFGSSVEGGLSVEQQVRKLIAQATSVENLCQGYYEGWSPHL